MLVALAAALLPGRVEAAPPAPGAESATAAVVRSPGQDGVDGASQPEDEGTEPQTPGSGPSITIDHQSLEVAPDGAFSVLLTVHDGPPGGHLAVDIYDRISDDESLGRAMIGDPVSKAATFPTVALSTEQVQDQPSGFVIQLRDGSSGRGSDPSWSWRIDEPGVHPVGIRLRDADGAELATAYTYLVRAAGPDQGAPKLNLALMATIEVPAAADAPIAPETIAAISDLASAASDNETVPMSFDLPATSVRGLADSGAVGADALDALRTVFERPDTELLRSTDVPIDAASLTANGLRDDVGQQLLLGADTLQDLLGRAPSETLALDLPIDQRTAQVLEDAGTSRIVAPPSLLAQASTGAPRRIAGTSELSAVTSGLMTADQVRATSDDPVRAASQLLALAVARAELASPPGAEVEPEAVATVIEVGPGSLDGDLLDALLARLAEPATSWQTMTVSELFEGTPASGSIDLPSIATLDMGPYIEARADLDGASGSYSSMVSEPDSKLEAYAATISQSMDRRLSQSQRLEMVNRIRDEVHGVFGSVTTAQTERVTLGARDADIPLRVLSTADTPLQVKVELQSSDRLDFAHDEMLVTLKPDGATVVPIPVHTRATGDTPMTVTLKSPDGAVVLSQTRYTVRSTAVSGVGIFLTVGAAGFLALWWGRHIIRARRRSPSSKM